MLGTVGEVGTESHEGLAAVEVVGVGDAEWFREVEAALGREYRLHRAAQFGLYREGHFSTLGPVPRHVLFDHRTGIGVDDDDDVVEARGVRVRGEEVDDALAVFTDRGELFYAAITTGATGGENYERRTAQRDHRTTADAQVIPAPKPVMSAYSPALIRPFSRASKNASGIDELDVLP